MDNLEDYIQLGKSQFDSQSCRVCDREPIDSLCRINDSAVGLQSLAIASSLGSAEELTLNEERGEL